MTNLDLTWCTQQLAALHGQSQDALPAEIPDLAVELAAVLELAAEQVSDMGAAIDELLRQIAVLDDRNAQQAWELPASPAEVRAVVRLALPWRVRRQALGWLWRPYLERPQGLEALLEALDATAAAAHTEACAVHAASAVSPRVGERIMGLVEAAQLELHSHLSTLDQARRCEDNLHIIVEALEGQRVKRRPEALRTRAPDPVRAAARAVVPLQAREAALSWLWSPHLASAA